MPTRRQNPEAAVFRQDAFASSAEHDRGSLGNLVAARCHKFTDPDVVAMYWWLQQVSWRDGGLRQFALDFLAGNASRIGTKSMHQYGMKPGQVYNAEQVRQVRSELVPDGENRFPLRGENQVSLLDYLSDDDHDTWSGRDSQKKAATRGTYPVNYAAGDFRKSCHIYSDEFAEMIMRAVVDPESEPLSQGLWNFPSLWEALTNWRQQEVDAAKVSIVETEITRIVFEELDFCLHSKSFILIEGLEGIGKTEAAKAWCAQHPGRAVYVRLDSGSDDPSLYRSLARAVGTACSYGYKTSQMRAKVQDALQSGDLMLVIDEAHFLWPQSERSQRSAPLRIEWLRTALVDFGVPVALISTPQYFAKACDKFLKSGWNAYQVQRRLAQTVILPEQISAIEMCAVAKRYFPKASLVELQNIAMTSGSKLGFLTVMMHLRKRVDFIAAKFSGRSESQCLDEALEAYKKKPEAPELPAATNVPALRLQKPSKASATAIPQRLKRPANISRINRQEEVAIV